MCFEQVVPRRLGRSAIVQGDFPMLIRDLLQNQETVAAGVETSVLEVARMMVERNIGAVPILDRGRLVGIFSERDLMSRVVVAARDPANTLVKEVMTEDPLTVNPTEELATCMTLMRRHGFRHLPVCDGSTLQGVVSLRDVLLHDLNEKDDEVRMMRAYLHSMPESS